MKRPSSTQSRFAWLSVVLATVPFAGTSFADDPIDNVSVEYRIHATPSDPNSPVTMRMIVNLSRQETNGSQVGWAPTSIEFRQLDCSGNPTNTWIEENPSADTTDGLWWVQHGDPNQPINNEFKLPPRFVGSAPSVNTAVEDLDYDFEGKNEYVPAPGEEPYETTAYMIVDLRIVVILVLIELTPDEPIELPPIDNPWMPG